MSAPLVMWRVLVYPGLMLNSPEQLALHQSLKRISPLMDIAGSTGAVLDLSSNDIDLSLHFLQTSKEVARLEGDIPAPEGVAAIKATATSTGLPDHSVDLVVVGGSRAKACEPEMLFEAARILKPQAGFVLAYAAPVYLPGTVPALSKNLALQFNPFWSETGDLHQISPHLSHLAMSGFVGGECHCLDSAVSFSREAWVSYCCTQPLIRDASLSPAELQDFRLVLHDYIKRDFGSTDFYVPFRALIYLAYRPQ